MSSVIWWTCVFLWVYKRFYGLTLLDLRFVRNILVSDDILRPIILPSDLRSFPVTKFFLLHLPTKF